MSPVAGVKLLAVHQNMIQVRSRIKMGRGLEPLWHSSVPPVTSVVPALRRQFTRSLSSQEVGDVRKTLFLIDNEIFDDRQVLSRCLFHQMRGSVAIRSRIIHVDVYVSAHPL